MMTRERFAETNWKMSYDEYQKCVCTECKKKNVHTEERIEDYLKLMVVLVCVPI